MRRRKIREFMKDKAFAMVLLLCVLSIAGIVAASILSEREDSKNNNNQYVDLNETEEETTKKQFVEKETETELKEPETTVAELVLGETDLEEIIGEGDAILVEGEDPTTIDMSNLMDATDEPQTSKPPVQVAASAINLSFSAEDKLMWPVEGNVILDFNMDSTIYFPTLEQYKCNPAIIIQGEVNTPVFAAVDGVVSEISSNEEIGSYVVMAIGDEHKLIYGQLKALEVSVGDMVPKGEVIGCISEPTKYYSVEGSNLYFEMTKNNVPVDSLDYIE
ncbi:MAG: M23 family metallopeptidase [Clostridiales bacterium]|nr:M23 family metallopeptidase [Clostridiales bacterium]